MRPEACETELLRRLAAMPFLDRLEMVAVSGRSRGAVYEAVRKLESGRLIASVPHATLPHPPDQALLPHRRRAAPAGERRGHDGRRVARRCPVSEQGRRVLMERLDAAAVVYRLAPQSPTPHSPSASGGTGPCPWTPP